VITKDDDAHGHLRILWLEGDEWTTLTDGVYRWAEPPEGLDWKLDERERRIGLEIRELNRGLHDRYGTDRDVVLASLRRLRTFLEDSMGVAEVDGDPGTPDEAPLTSVGLPPLPNENDFTGDKLSWGHFGDTLHVARMGECSGSGTPICGAGGRTSTTLISPGSADQI